MAGHGRYLVDGIDEELHGALPMASGGGAGAVALVIGAAAVADVRGELMGPQLSLGWVAVALLLARQVVARRDSARVTRQLDLLRLGRGILVNTALKFPV